MDNPHAYRKWKILRDHESEILQKYSKLISWRTDQLDSVLDIGCAGGDVTNDLILPLLPEKFTRLVGADINENMVQFALRNYTNSKSSFHIMDLGGDISEFLNEHEEFDHVISLLCLHLIPDQKTAIENIYKLLKSTGDCLLYIISDARLFDIYHRLYVKWKKYFPKVDSFISPYYRRVNPEEMLEDLMKSAGFQTTFVEKVKHTISFSDLNSFKGTYESVIPFISGIPSELQEEFMDDFVKLAMSYNDDNNNIPQGVRIEMPYQFLLAYASKKCE